MNLFKKTFIALLGIALAGGAVVTTALTNQIDTNDLTKVKAAEEVTTITFDSTSGSVGDISYTTSSGGNQTAPAINNGMLRLYQKNTITFSTDAGTIQSIEITDYDIDKHSWANLKTSNGTWEDTSKTISNINSPEVTLTNGNSGSGHFRFGEVVVTISLEEQEPIVSVSLSGDMTKKEYYDNESWDTTGLIVKGNDGTVDINAKDITWTFTPEAPALGVTSVEVVANYNELSSDPLTIEGITVSEAPNLISDVITASDLVSSSSYSDFTNKQFDSDAVYSGRIANNSNRIQLNNSDSDKGIISTKSGGKIKQVNVKWNSGTSNARILEVYLNNNPFTSASDLYSNSTDDKFELAYNETTLDVTGDYQYVGIRSKSGAMYLDSVTFVWEPAEEKEISSVTLSGTLEKTQYYTNEQWDTTGLVASVNYSDNESETLVVGHEFIFDPATPVLGTQQVKIKFTYEGFTSNELSFDVNVLEYVEPVYTYEPTGNPSGNPFIHDGVTWEYYFNEGSKLSSFQSDKGLHFGTGTEPTTSLNFFSDAFIKDNKALITRIDVNASTASANSEDVTLNVRVNNNVVGTTILTSSATDYSFVLTTPMWGHVEIEMIDNDPEHDNAAVYLKYIYIYATEDEVASTLIPVINALEDIYTCDVVENDEKFDAFLTTYKTLVDEYRTTLEDVIVYDYGFGDTSYSGNRLLRTDFITKYDACNERYLGAYNASPIIATYDNSTLIATIVVVSVVSLSALCVFFIYERKRRLSK